MITIDIIYKILANINDDHQRIDIIDQNKYQIAWSVFKQLK